MAKSFWVMPLLCRPCWITLPTSRGTLSWCSSSVSRSSLAVFFVMKCCLFWPAAPVTQSKNKPNQNKPRTNKTRLSAVPNSIKVLFLSSQLLSIPGSFQDFNVPTSAQILPIREHIILILLMLVSKHSHAEPTTFSISHLNFTPDRQDLTMAWRFIIQLWSRHTFVLQHVGGGNTQT